MISVATFEFSSKKNDTFSDTIDSTTVLAAGLPNFDLVCPSNCKRFSGILSEIIAVNPSLTSLPSNDVSFPFKKLFFLAYSLNTLVRAVLKPTSRVPPSPVFTLLTNDIIFSLYVSVYWNAISTSIPCLEPLKLHTLCNVFLFL